jgi:hypothetical protein
MMNRDDMRHRSPVEQRNPDPRVGRAQPRPIHARDLFIVRRLELIRSLRKMRRMHLAVKLYQRLHVTRLGSTDLKPQGGHPFRIADGCRECDMISSTISQRKFPGMTMSRSRHRHIGTPQLVAIATTSCHRKFPPKSLVKCCRDCDIDLV